jgi:hypothetical protein
MGKSSVEEVYARLMRGPTAGSSLPPRSSEKDTVKLETAPQAVTYNWSYAATSKRFRETCRQLDEITLLVPPSLSRSPGPKSHIPSSPEGPYQRRQSKQHAPPPRVTLFRVITIDLQIVRTCYSLFFPTKKVTCE